MSRSILIPFGASWRYRHEDAPVDPHWTAPDFDDRRWPAGRAPLGYNTAETGTRIPPGASFKRRPLTAQFRHAFRSDTATLTAPLRLAVHRNTGLRVFLNGELAAWDGIRDDGAAATSSDTRDFPLQFAVPSRLLRPDRNVVAVELRHAQRAYSSLTFDLALAGGSAPLDRTSFAAAAALPIPEPIAPGHAVPDFRWIDIATRRTRSLREFFGKPFVLQFSGAECRPCWKKLPIIRRWADAGLACLSISSWGTIDDMAVTARRHPELLAGIAVGAEADASDAYLTACYTKYGIFNGSILVGADERVVAVATGFTLEEYLPEAAAMDDILRATGYRIAPVPNVIEVSGGAEDWRVVTSLSAP